MYRKYHDVLCYKIYIENYLRTYIHGIHSLHIRRSNEQFIIDAAAANNISAVRSIFDSLDWSEESYRMFEKVGQTGEQVHLCFSSTNKVSIYACACIHIKSLLAS